MIKGIIALFTTGIMFNPLAWLGIPEIRFKLDLLWKIKVCKP